jgi:IS30 family transposase
MVKRVMARSVRLSLEERIKIKEYLDKGFKGNEIARLLGRAFSAVNNDVRRNGGKENYDPQKAQEEANLRWKMRCESTTYNLTKFYGENGRCLNLAERVQTLEMQLEIIIDQLKELYVQYSKNKGLFYIQEEPF